MNKLSRLAGWVYATLATHGPMSTAALAGMANVTTRTIRYALAELREAGLEPEAKAETKAEIESQKRRVKTRKIKRLEAEAKAEAKAETKADIDAAFEREMELLGRGGLTLRESDADPD